MAFHHVRTWLGPIAVCLVLWVQVPLSAQEFQPEWKSLNEREAPAWLAEAKFGIFIHWGVYSVPAFCDTSTYSEWYQHWYDTNSHGGLVRRFHHENYGEDFAYRDFAPLFRAEMWKPEEWAEIFKRSGARYVVLTSKHHDGYCLWPSQVASDVRGYPWNSVAVGPRRDLVGELTKAVRAAGLRMGLYYSFLEWHNPIFDEDKPRYVEEVMFPQIRELLQRYRPDIFWPDGEWNHPDTLWRSPEILAWIYNQAPNREQIVVNDRWGKGLRSHTGDYYTTEYGGGGSEATGGRRPFEECRGIGHSFAFNRAEGYDIYLSRTETVRLLVDLVGRGGMLLLDIGPTADGRIPLIMVDRLLALGRWLERHGESIWGATRSPFAWLPWGTATVKEDRLYLHVYDWPEDDVLSVPGLRSKVLVAHYLSDSGPRAAQSLPLLPAERGAVRIDLRGRHPDPHVSVIRLHLNEVPRVELAFHPATDGSLELPAAAARIEGGALRLESVSTDDGRSVENLGFWTSLESTASWEAMLQEGCNYRIEALYGLQPGNEGGEFELQVGESKMEAVLERPTAGWQTYRWLELGSLRATASGRTQVIVRAVSIPEGKALMNLRSVRFVPTN